MSNMRAQVNFNPTVGAWVCGYYDMTRGGGPYSWNTFSTEAEAHIAADKYNREQSPPLAIAPKKRKRTPRPDQTYVDLMFKDTVSGEMLRTLCALGDMGMSQAEFMDVYHVRCDRPPRVCQRCWGTKLQHEYVSGYPGELGPYRKVVPEQMCTRCIGTGKAPESRSSFGNNFGRFVNTSNYWIGERNELREEWRNRLAHPIRCIKHYSTPSGRKSKKRGQNWLYWDGDALVVLLRRMRDDQLTTAEMTMERIATGEKYPSTYTQEQIDAETNGNMRWLDLLRDEMARRRGLLGTRAA